MENIIKNIIALIILGIAVFVFRDPIKESYYMLQDKYYPCSRTITYSIGTFDSSFGVSPEEFLSAVKESENTWETVVGKNLLEYMPMGGELKINLVYDNRQKSTQRLQEIDQSLDYKKSSYNSLKNKVDILQTEYKQKKLLLESKIVSLKDRQGRYSGESITYLNNLQTELNDYVSKINSSINELNASASSFNNQAKDYNRVGDNLGEEFEEGLYHSDKNGKYIDIYQFEDENKLKRVLMHEIGHALFLNHTEDPDSIMYMLNIGNNLIPSDLDMKALRDHCGLK